MFATHFRLGLDLYETVPGYEETAHCLHALQLVLHERARGSIAQHLAVSAIWQLQEAIGGMPEDIAERWGRYCRLGKIELERQVRDIDANRT